MSKYLEVLARGFLAGMMIAIAAVAYLSFDNHYVGALAFSVGLYTIYTLDFYLYTGKVGFILESRAYLDTIVIWFGNLLGGVAVALAVLNTRIAKTSTIVSLAQSYSEVKINDALLSSFILGIFCGIMMYIAAASYKKLSTSVGSYVAMILCVMVFLLSGFEHSIANMFYFTVSSSWSFKAVVALIVVSLGNAVGGLIIPVCTLVKFKQS